MGKREEKEVLMLIQITQVDKGWVPEAFLRYLPKMMQRAFAVAGEHWLSKYRPLHFTEAAYARYGYKRREGRYEERKRKQHGHNKPLTYTGRSEALSAAGVVRATRHGVKVVMNAPQLNFKGAYAANKDGSGTLRMRWYGPRMDMRDELTRVNTGEAYALAGVVRKSLEDQVGVAVSFGKRERI